MTEYEGRLKDEVPAPESTVGSDATDSDVADSTADVDAASDPADLAGALAKAEAERDEYLDDLKRVAADFDNFRKRAVREKEELQVRAAERVLKELLPIADDLDRALEAATDHAKAEEAKLVEGVEMVRRQMGLVLAKEGIEEVSTEGPFDPHVHEALTSLPADVPEGSILEVISKGYTLAGRVLRPARVIIARAPEPGLESAEG
jgi:molecular chaperone GrpE